MSQSPSISLEVNVAMDTDIGRKRKQNQDAIGHMIPTTPDVLADLGQIFVLADGVGGLSGGDLASQYAVSTIISSYYAQEEGDPPERLARAIAEANNVIYAEGQGGEIPHTMATTVVAAVIRGRELIIGSVGDSPAYLMRDAHVRKLTLDHTVEAMQREAGIPLPAGDPSGRKLVRALGGSPSVKVDIISGFVRGGDHVVLCSDGLTRYVPPEEIERAVATRPPARSVKMLIETANERGGADNISVIVLRLSDEDSTPTPPLENWSRHTESTPPAPAASASASPAAPRPARPDSPLRELGQRLRGNAVITIIGLAVLLIAFALVILIIDNAGKNNPSPSSGEPSATRIPPDVLTSTAVLHAAATAQAVAIQTSDAIQASEAIQAATNAVITLTPPPPAGPQMEKDDWFRVLPGEPIDAYQEASLSAAAASPLQAGSAYLIQEVDREAWNGPWYWVVDNQGIETRWVSGPSLHQRALRISSTGDALPPEQQPTDLAPAVTPTATRTPSPTVSETGEDSPFSSTPGIETPGLSDAATNTHTPTTAPAIGYGVERWVPGSKVAVVTDLILRRTPDVDGAETGDVTAGEIGTVLEGPTASGEHWWWRVQFEDGREGWIAQVLLSAS